METSSEYLSYVHDMQNYKINDGRKQYQEPFRENFEEIYQKAQNSDIKLSNAKEFLQNLTSSELSTVKNFSSLAEKIDIDSLSDEGAYNLLMHDYEKYDFNNDGTMEVGIANSAMPVPKNMPSDVRVAYIDAMNSLSDKDRMMSMKLTFNISRLSAHINGTEYKPQMIDYNYLSSRVDASLNPKPPAFTSEAAKESVRAFWKAFENSYTGDKTQKSDEEKTSSEVEAFLEKLTSKGAIKFLADLNMEKIQAKIDEYREKLIAQMGDSPEAMKDIQKLVADFTKQLIEELQNSLDNNKESKPILSMQAQISSLLKLQKDDKQPLEELLSS